MKAKFFCIALLLSLLLSGCACQHEWTQADCLNPQICAKCDETAGEPLGHQWTDASCTHPETCQRCGETQGEPLSHNFGSWTFTETDMSHSCADCGLEETTALDREVCLEAMLSGIWEGDCLYQGENFYSAYQFSAPLDMLHFDNDHSVKGRLNTSQITGRWEFQEHRAEEEEHKYYFCVETDDAHRWNLLLSQRAKGTLLYIFYANDDQVLLTQKPDTAAALANAGCWGAPGSTGMYSLTFHEDRSVTGNLGHDFEGTWHLMPVSESFGMQYCGLYIQYIENDEPVTVTGTITASENGSDAENSDSFVPGNITIRIGNTRSEFQPMTTEELEAQNQMMQQGSNMILGTWSSIYWRKLGSSSSPAVDKSLLNYSITFHSDNTFTASVDKEITGTWKYDDNRSNFIDENNGNLHYYLHIDGDRYTYQCDLVYREGQMPQFNFWGDRSYQGNNKGLVFLKLSQEDSLVINRLIGDWTSIREDINHHTTGESTQIYTQEYHFTFQEDGTFTGYDGTELRGTWNLARVFYEENDHRTFYFDLNTGDPNLPYTLIIYDHGDEMYVDFRETRSEFQRWLRMEQLSQEDLDAAAIAPTIPVGEWISSYVTHYAEEGGSDEKIETSDYCFLISEDGTFTAQLDSSIQGTWGFREYQEDSGYYFWFDYPGMSQYGPHYFFVGKDEDFLTFRLFNDDQESFYYMVRK